MVTDKITGRKDDATKTKAGLVLQDFSLALMAVSALGTFGIQKYGASNWLRVDDAVARYTDAMSRHFLSEGSQEVDPETGMHHAVAVAWNALARLELMIREEERLNSLK